MTKSSENKPLAKSSRLWDKGGETDELMHQLTVGEDPFYDLNILYWDCIATIAHVRVIEKAGILTKGEADSVVEALNRLSQKAKAGEIVIPDELEDAHTTLETLLVEELGDIGKKIHTGRSRNDQVLVATRLFLKNKAIDWISVLLSLADSFESLYKKYKDQFLPGYTHLQPAMPATVGMWAHAFYEGALELAQDGFAYIQAVDRNPLGAAAGFGSSLNLDRQLSSDILGFREVQGNFIDIQNSRGRYEERLLFWGVQVALIFEKFAWDTELFCTKEFGFVSLPDRLTTGSSIMPQKKNPDIVELLRGRCGKIRGYLSQIQWIAGKLPSNYHRDLQLLKEPLFNGIAEVENVFASVKLIAEGMTFNQEALAKADHPELYATYDAYRMVAEGVPFRDAYKTTAANVKEGKITNKGYEREVKRIIDEVDLYMKKAVKSGQFLKEKLANFAV